MRPSIPGLDPIGYLLVGRLDLTQCCNKQRDYCGVESGSFSLLSRSLATLSGTKFQTNLSAELRSEAKALRH